MENKLPDRVRLGVFEVDLRAGELRSGQRSLIVPEQALRILRMLIEADGKLVAREDIRKKLWPNDTVVEFDHSINTAIRNLRRALGDTPEEPKYIETIPRRGYRLLVPVERVEIGGDSSDAEEKPRREEKASELGGLPASANGNLIGKKVSHYRVLEVLGGGGMGMLYKAEDLKLGRQVALKFLPEELAWDTVALQRFEREARTASSLDHPNICTIHEVEEHAGQPFIVMQLLQGRTLRDRLYTLSAEQRKLPLDELLEIAVQICAGLQAAHAKGIIHRDIKPANIFLTTTGQVKILDFGLAKLVSTTPEDGSDDPELGLDGAAAQTARSVPPDSTLTRIGVAMGTAGYMSPEQVRGEKLDARTDIFSFGLVLYDMATGQRAFTGETATIVHNAIVNDPPVPATELNREIPSELEAIISKALEKDREQRYQTASELLHELESFESESNLQRTTAPIAVKPKRPRSFWLALSLVSLLAILTALLLGVSHVVSRERLVMQQLTHNPPGDRVTATAISPDGKYMAYHDQTGLYLRTTASGETHTIGLPGALPTGLYGGLFWFPEGGKLLADVDGKGLWVIPVAGEEQPRLLYEMGVDPAISPDGRTVAFVQRTYEDGREGRHELWIGNVDGETPRKLFSADEADQLLNPAWSPDGQWISYRRSWKTPQGKQLCAIEASPSGGGPAKTILAESSLPESNTLDWYAATWSPDWRLVFVVARNSNSGEEGSLWQLRMEPGTAQAAGKPEQLTQWDDSCCGNLATTSDGRQLGFVKYRIRIDEYMGELSPDGSSMKMPRHFDRTQQGRGGPSSWTHDSRFLLFDLMRDGRWEIFRRSPDNTVKEKLITGSSGVCCAETSPDGAWLLYLEWDLTLGETSNATWLMRRPIGGGPEDKVLAMPDVGRDEFRCSSNPSASSPCVVAMTEGEKLVFYSLDPIKEKGRRLGEIAAMGFSYMRGWDLSPDGSRVAVVSAHKGKTRVESSSQIEFGARIDVLTLSDGTWHRILAEPADHNSSGDNPEATWFYQIAWTADGKGFYVLAKIGDSSDLLHITSDGKAQPLIANESYQNQFLADLLPSPDGKYLAFECRVWDGNVWMIDKF